MASLTSVLGSVHSPDLSAALSQRILVIDPTVDDYQRLAAEAIEGTVVYTLKRDRDGVEQITELLQPYSYEYINSGSFSLHIVSHGSPGCLYIGNSTLNLENISAYESALQSWRVSSLLLYGCNVATGDAGSEFVEKLHRFTGANIAASNTPTGSAALGGDWDLSVRVGKITPELAFQAETMASYAGVLNSYLRVEFGGQISLDTTDMKSAPYAIEFRIRPRSLNSPTSVSNQRYITVAANGDSSWGIYYDRQSGLYVFGQKLFSSFVSGSPIPGWSGLNEWVHIAIVSDGSTAKLYFNAQDSNLTASVNQASWLTSLGFAYNDGFGLEADFDEVRLWRSQRTASEILQYRDQPLPSSWWERQALAGYFQFEIPSSAGHDSSNNGRSFQSFNAAIYSDNRPPTGLSLSNTTTPENNPNGSVIGTLTTTDSDSGDAFTYTLLNDAGGRFGISGDQIRVLNGSLLDFEASTSHTIRVRTTDRAGAFYDQDFSINLTNVNEAPTNVTLTGTTIAENSVVGTVIGSLASTDPDANSSFTYQLVTGTGDADNSKFEVVGNQIKLKESLDFEAQSSYTIRVQTADQNGLFFEKQLTITATDVNEIPTSLSLSTDSVDENITATTTAATFITLDPDATESFIYELINGEGDTDNAAFQVVGNQLRFVNPPDYETQSSYSLRVKVTDKGGLTIEKNFTITINDVNEAPTSLTLSNSTVDENSDPTEAIGSFAATDPDTGETFTYRLADGTGDTDNDAFEIVGNQLRLSNSPNFEAQSNYKVRVSVTDSKGLSFEKPFTVTVNDLNDAPSDLSLSNSAIADGVLANSVVGEFSTTDQDANERFTYELVSGLGDEDNGAFTLIDNELRINRSPNFDLKSDYSLRVRTTDKSGASLERIVRLVVNKDNDAPTDLNLSQTQINENTSINALVGALSSLDPNPGNTFTYSLVGGAGAADNAAFAIAGNDLILRSPANFEAKPSYSIRLRTTDQSGASFDRAFTIAVNDLNEAPVNITLSSSSVAENGAPDTVIGTLSSADPDANNSFTYSLAAGAGDGDNSVFEIAGDQLKLKVSANFEAKPNYRIRVRTTDQNGLFFEKNLTIRVTDVTEAPTNLSLSSLSVNENVPVNTVIGRLSSVDPDANNSFTYSLVSGTGDTDNASFAVVGNELRIQTSPDFETKSSYSVRVRTTDQNGLSFERAQTIQVRNLNEVPTGFSLSANKLNEGAAAGTVVGTLRSSDPDAGNTFTYTLVDGNGSTNNANFTIAGNQLRFQNAPTGPAPATYSVRIRTTDQGGLSFEEPVTIQVNGAPTDVLLSNVRINENAPANTVVGNLAAIDRDAGNTFAYQLVAGTGDKDNNAFAIINNQLQIRTPLDFEKQPSYSIRVQATDQDGAKFQKPLEVVVGDVNEKPTSLRLGFTTLTENQYSSIPLVGIDPDASDRNRLTYSLIDGPGSIDNNAFTIAGSSLFLKQNTADFEKQSSYSVRLRVQDAAGESLEQSFTIAVRDVNEAPTDIKLNSDRVPENFPADFVFAEISGVDPDTTDSLTYSLVGDNPDNQAFYIQGNQLRTRYPLDFESKSSYSIRLQVSDRGGLSIVKPFTINVEDTAETAIPSLETDDTKTSLRLDGVNDYIKVSKESTFDLTNAITAEGWFKVDSWTKPWQSIITKGDSAWRISRAGEGNALEFAIGPGADGRFLQGNKAVNDGRWHHVAATYDGSTMKLYVDGVLDAEKAMSGPIATNDFEVWLGANAEAPGRNFAGQLDEFRVWNVARSESDIKTSLRRSVDPSNPNLVGYWKLNDGSSDKIASSKAGDNNGTLVNGDSTNWDTTSPVLLGGSSSGGSGDSSSGETKEDEFLNWSQLQQSLLATYNNSTTPISGRTAGVIETAFSVFESGETNPANTPTATATFKPNSIELAAINSPMRVDLANLLMVLTRFNNIPVPIPAVLGEYGVSLPLVDGALSITDLRSAPIYELSARVQLSEDDAKKGSFLTFLKKMLDQNELILKAEVNSALTAPSAALMAELKTDKTIFNAGGFELAFIGGELGIGLSATGDPGVSVESRLALRNYDPFQSNEPDLQLTGLIELEPESFSIGAKLGVAEGDEDDEAPKVWKNPFGIPDSELRNIGVKAGGSYIFPFFDNYSILGDLKFGNFDLKAAFATDINDANKNAMALTVNQPVSLLDLYLGPVQGFVLKQVGKRVQFVQDALGFLDRIVDLRVGSFDSDGDGDIDPLLSAALFPADILGEKIQPGLSINGKLSAWGKEATLNFSGNPFNVDNPNFSGALTVPNIDLKFIKLSGVNQPNLNLAFNASLRTPSISGAISGAINNNMSGLGGLNASLTGSGRLEIFGQTVASANFSFSPTQVRVRDLLLNFGVLEANLKSLEFDLARFSGSGSGEIKLFNQKIAEGSFTLSDGKFSAKGSLGIDVLGAEVGISAQIDLSKDYNRIQLSGSLMNKKYNLLDASLGSFAKEYDAIDDLVGLVKNQIPNVSDLAKQAIKSLFSVFDGYIEGGTIFFDANLNGVFDDNEPFTITDAGGGFNLNVDLATFDTNGNKRIDVSEGRYVLSGGTDTSTMLPMITPLSAVLSPDAKVVSPLTTIIAELAQQGLDPEAAQTQLETALGLKANVDLSSFDPLQAIANGDARGVGVFAATIAVQSTIVQTAKFVDGVSGQPVTQLATGAIAAIANQIKSGSPVDFGKAETIQAIVQAAITKAAESDPTMDLSQISTLVSAAAQVIAQGNQIIQEAAASGRPGKEIALNIARLQAVVMGPVANQMTQLAAGEITLSDFQTQTSRDALLKRMTEVQINDPTVRPLVDGAKPTRTLFGTDGNDRLMGNSVDDVLVGMKGQDRLMGKAGSDILQGDNGKDTLLGDKGDDYLVGGDGRDSLAGGAGKDRFVLNVTASGRDRIIDFNIKADLLEIDGVSEGFVSGQSITNKQFRLGSKATDRTDRLIYNPDNGALFYDADGRGGSPQTQLAQLSKGLDLTARQIVVG